LCVNNNVVVVTDTDKIQRTVRCRGNCRRWIWCCTSCKTSTLGNSCVQGAEVF